jgi:carbonic anhydrase
MKKPWLAAALCLAIAPALTPAQEFTPWSYQGGNGPAHWAELDMAYKKCKFGLQQSPINIETAKVKRDPLRPTVFAYKSGPAEMVNDGHSIQVNLPAGSTVTIDGVAYKLLEFHFHTPSEELIDGKPYPLEVHLVHKDVYENLAFVAILFKEGKENPGLKPIFSSLPAKVGGTKKLPAVDPAAMLPDERSFYEFIGSLTTPPCSENVLWRVLKTPVEVSPSQLAAFRKLYKMNARPVQPLNGRIIEESQSRRQAAGPAHARSGHAS